MKNLNKLNPTQQVIFNHSTFDSDELNTDEIKMVNTAARKFFGHDIVNIKYEDGERKLEISAENQPKPKPCFGSLISEVFFSIIEDLISLFKK